MIARAASCALFALLASASAACVSPATEVMVVLDTDVPAGIGLAITATVRRGTMATGGTSRTWVRNTLEGTPVDGGIALPTSFAIVPGTDATSDAPVSLFIEAQADTASIRRRATFSFVPHSTLVLPVFLTVRCLAPADGCTDPANCTLQRRCEEQGLTCGNDGGCVAVAMPQFADGGLDAAFGDVPAIPCGQYHEPCCLVGTACEGELSCVGHRCQRCTDEAEVCCQGDALLPDGTECAAASDPCHTHGTCTQGVCSPVVAVPDGTSCGAAPDPCHAAPVCRAGTCGAPAPVTDGTVCASTADTCQVNGTCRAGVCSGLANQPDGTVCASTTQPCKRAGTCRAGVCSGLSDAPDGTVCAMAPDACHNDGTCHSGVCGAVTAKANGTVCATTTNPCATPGTCTNGHCGALGSKPNGTAWGSGGLQRCCGGAAVTVNSASNCDACGVRCASGQSCTRLRGQSQYYCSPCVANSACWSGCCSYYYGNPYACAASDCSGGCISCPGGASCHTANGNPNYCGY